MWRASNLGAAICVVLGSLSGGCSDSPGSDSPDAAVTPDAAPAALGPYRGDILVDATLVYTRLDTYGDGCVCGFWVPGPNGCDEASDVPTCAPRCTPCLAALSIESAAGTLTVPSELGRIDGQVEHGGAPGETIELVIDGCLGRHVIQAQVPDRGSVTVAAPTEVRENVLEVTWSPAWVADEVEIAASETFGGVRCRRSDSGAEIIEVYVPSLFEVEVRQLWVVSELPDSDVAAIELYEARTGRWQP